ncbi:MAG: D-arabinono-1,4-lactone oxidase [Thermodesulfobacteriota bacterium]
MSDLWISWSGRVRCAPTLRVWPASEGEVADAVRSAARAGRVVRVAGSGHSFTPLVASDGVLLALDSLHGIESVDRASSRATIRAGSKLASLGEPLRAVGLALANQGDVDVQALAGALATGTHGTGATLGSISSQLVGLRLVTAAGETLEIDAERDADTLAAARVSLGVLGVVTAARLQLVPAYRLHERIWKVGIDECLDGLPQHVSGHRHFEFFWYPHRDHAEMKALDPTDAPADPLEGRKGERIDWSYRVFPTVRDLRFNEMEYAVPAAAGPACFRAVRSRMRERHPDVLWPVEYRTLAADDGWLSPAHARDSVAISLHQDAALPCDEFFADVEPIFHEHGGRPHWGKIHTLTASRLASLYPRWEAFLALRSRLDPDGLFLNAYLRELLGA